MVTKFFSSSESPRLQRGEEARKRFPCPPIVFRGGLAAARGSCAHLAAGEPKEEAWVLWEKNYSGFLAFLQAVPVAIRASLVAPGTGLAAQKVSLFRGGAAGCCCLGEVGGSEMLRVPRCCVALVPAKPGESQQETQEAEKDDEGQVALEGRPRRLQNLLVHVHGGKYRDVVGVILDGCVQVITKTRCVVI